MQIIPKYLLKQNKEGTIINTSEPINKWVQEVTDRIIELAPCLPDDKDSVLSLIELINEKVLNHYFPKS